jgi:hypothetical protein
MEISNGAPLNNLIIEGVVSEQVLYNNWEDILRKNSKANNNLEFLNHFEAAQKYTMLMSLYTTVKACLMKLTICPDIEVIKYLRTEGYFIDGSSFEAYSRSVIAASNLSDNLATKIEAKEKELMLFKVDNDVSTGIGFEEGLASLSYMVGFNIPDDVSLAKYNEYKRIIRKQNGIRNQQGRNPK